MPRSLHCVTHCAMHSLRNPVVNGPQYAMKAAAMKTSPVRLL